MKRAISFALVLLVVAAGLAGCIGTTKLPPTDVSEPSRDPVSEESSADYSQPAAASTAGGTTAAKTTAAKATSAKPPVADESEDYSGNRPVKATTGAAFFDDAVFVGDSVTLGLKNNATAQRNAGKNYLGKARFLCSGSLSYSNCTLDLNSPKSVHPKIKGKKVYIEDGVKMLGAKKVFIMLGMNDFAAYNNDKVISSATALVKRIIKKSPGIRIYIESVTPITADKQHGRFNNKNVDAFNRRLKAMCDQNGWTYVDVNSQFKDDEGNLNPVYCGDPQGMGIHMAKKGCDKWVDFLTASFAV